MYGLKEGFQKGGHTEMKKIHETKTTPLLVPYNELPESEKIMTEILH